MHFRDDVGVVGVGVGVGGADVAVDTHLWLQVVVVVVVLVLVLMCPPLLQRIGVLVLEIGLHQVSLCLYLYHILAMAFPNSEVVGKAAPHQNHTWNSHRILWCVGDSYSKVSATTHGHRYDQ